MREREREKERERELRELGGLERERSTHKETLLEILWCDDYLDSLLGVWNNGTAWKTPPKRKFHTERLKAKAEGSTLLTYTGLSGGLEHLKIETTLIDERFVRVMGECMLVVYGIIGLISYCWHVGTMCHAYWALTHTLGMTHTYAPSKVFPTLISL